MRAQEASLGFVARHHRPEISLLRCVLCVLHLAHESGVLAKEEHQQFGAVGGRMVDVGVIVRFYGGVIQRTAPRDFPAGGPVARPRRAAGASITNRRWKCRAGGAAKRGEDLLNVVVNSTSGRTN